MSTRLLLQGTEIESLLARVRSEHGPTARIVKAERVRAGGVGGFFAREHFEVTVEVGDDTAAMPAPTTPAAAPVPARRGDDASRAEVGGDRTGRLDVMETATESVEDLLAGVDAVERAVQAWSPPRVDRSTVQARTPQPRTPQPRTSEPAHRPVSTEGAAFADVLQTLTDNVEREHVAATVPAQQPGPEQQPAPEQAAPPTTAPVPQAPAQTPPRVPAQAPVAHRLARLGLPVHMLARATSSDVVDQVREAVAQLPAPPALRLPVGGVVAVVGPERQATRAATALAERLHLGASGVLVAGASPAVPARRRLAGLPEARRRAALSRARETAVVVVVPVEVDDDPQWAHDLLDALSPEQIWATVDATRKTADTRRHLRHLSGATGFDCLAVHGTTATADPATVLELGVPVGLLDGAAATSGAWAALLLERLLAGEA